MIKRFQLQPIMTHVLVAVAPAALAGVYFFGWRVLALLAVCMAAAFAAEAAFTWPRGKPVTAACLVTATLFTLSLPPGIPFWIAVVGVVFGIIFGKMAFGGTFTNIFNPALVGRCFIYISFPIAMTARWAEPFSGAAAGFSRWGVDAATMATPLSLYKQGVAFDYHAMFLGTTGGCIGETSALLILLGGLYLVYRKAASWQIILGCLGGGAGSAAILHAIDPAAVGGPLFQLLAGGFMFGAVFMATDPVSAAKTVPGKWIFGILVGIMAIILRGYSNFSCGVMFAILIVNMFVPLIDIGVKKLTGRNKTPSAPVPTPVALEPCAKCGRPSGEAEHG